MKRSLAFAALVSGLATLTPAASVPAHAESATDAASRIQRAEQMFHQGTDAFEAGRFADAYASLRKAWDLAPGYRTAAGLGQVELQLGQYRDAAAHLSYCLRHFPSDGDASVRGHVEDGFALARGHVGELRIQVDVPDAIVSLDGIRLGQSPLEEPVFVEPGAHSVTALRSGFEEARQGVEVTRQGTRDVSLTLRPISNAQREKAEQAPVPERTPRKDAGAPQGPSSSAWALIVGGSLTGLLLAGAVLFRVEAQSAETDMENLRAQIGAGYPCATPSSPKTALCAELSDKGDARNRDNETATVLGVSSGVLLAATVSSAIALGGFRDSKHDVALSVGVAHGSPNLSVRGSF